jgi:hypothetical protein
VLKSPLMSIKTSLRTMLSTKLLIPLCDMSSIARVPSKLKITGPTRADVTSVLKVWSTRQRFGKNDEDHFHLGLRGLVNESEGFPFLLGHLRHANQLSLSMKYCSYTWYLSSIGRSIRW